MTGTKMMAGMGASTNMGGVMTLGEGMMMDGGTTLGKEMTETTLGKEMTGGTTLGKEMAGGKALGKEMKVPHLDFTWN